MSFSVYLICDCEKHGSLGVSMVPFINFDVSLVCTFTLCL